MGERFNKLDRSFIDFLLNNEIIKNFFINNTFNKNLTICNKIRNYYMNNKDLNLSINYGYYPDKIFDSIFNGLFNEIKQINEEIANIFNLKCQIKFSEFDIIIKKNFYFKLKIQNCSAGSKLKIKNCLKYFPYIEIKIGDNIEIKETNYKCCILEESKILIFYISNNNKNYANINFILDSEINLLDYQLAYKNIFYKLKSYIYGKDLYKTKLYYKNNHNYDINLEYNNYIILIYYLEEKKVIDNKNITNTTLSNHVNYNINNISNKSNVIYFVKGLINIDGSYCYMNSVIQCLYSLFIFRDEFLKKKYTYKQPISLALQNVMIGLLEENNKPYDPTNFKNVLSNNIKLFKSHAGDPSDLILYLLDKLHEEDKCEAEYNDIKINEENEKEVYNSCLADIDKSIISDLFYGYYGEKSICSKCGRTFYLIEPKFLVELNVEEISKKINKKTIKLNEYFNKYYNNELKKYFICPICGGKKLATIKSYIKKLPKILVIIFKNSDCHFKIEIEDKFKCNNSTLKLIGVSTIAYRPTSSYYGHAIAFCLHNEQFFLFNDRIVRNVDFNDFKDRDHYLLFYLVEN